MTTETPPSKPRRRGLLISIIALFIIGMVAVAAVAHVLYAPNFKPAPDTYIYIRPDDDFDALCQQLIDSAGCQDIRTFKLLAQAMNYPQAMRTGCYAVGVGTGNLQLLRNLRNGAQAPVQITFNNIRTVDELAERLSKQLMISSDELLAQLTDEQVCRSLGFTTETVKALFIPNTYEIYWNTSAEKLLQRMKREYDTFWNADRRTKAERIGISPIEVAILAAIVEEESAAVEEYPDIAGLYINRLYKNMPLQADPTVKYAVGDFTLRRVLERHLAVESPYNTYLHTGLPPGPIRLPSVKALDGVLNYNRHNYLYMCAKEDFSGRHNFAVTIDEHNANASRYRAALNHAGIY